MPAYQLSSQLSQPQLVARVDGCEQEVPAREEERAERERKPGAMLVREATGGLPKPADPRPLPVIGSNKIERILPAAKACDLELEREDWYAFWEAAQGRQIP